MANRQASVSWAMDDSACRTTTSASCSVCPWTRVGDAALDLALVRSSPAAAVGLVATDRAAPHGVHPEHLGAAALADDRVTGRGALRRRLRRCSHDGLRRRPGLRHAPDYSGTRSPAPVLADRPAAA